MTDKLAVVAVGGNALTREDQQGSCAEIMANAAAMAEPIAAMARQGWRIVVVHGNGPQIGSLALQHDAGVDVAPIQPFWVLGAMAQGQLGSALAQALDARLGPAGALAVITHVVVDADDPAFAEPTKPVGPFYTQERSAELAAEHGWTMVEDSNRGYRRVVASPAPQSIVEADAIRALVQTVPVLIAAGGGGVPVVARPDAGFDGVSAVIDKDLAAALLAEQLSADLLALVTAVPAVSLDFGTPQQRVVEQLGLSEAERHLADGQFPPGSMGPKVRAAVSFVRGRQGTAVITSAEHLAAILDPQSRAGTRIVPDAADS